MTNTFDPSKPCTTRDGRPARVLARDLAGRKPLAVATLSEQDGTEYVSTYDLNGSQMGREETRSDLINTPEEHEVVVYLHRGGGVTETNSQGFALASKRVKFIENEFEE